MNLDSIIDKVSLSKEKQVSLFIFCVILIIVSKNDFLVEFFQIESLLLNLMPTIAVLLFFLFGTIIGKPIYDFFKNKYIGYVNNKNMNIFLQQLTNDEKDILRYYLTENKRTQYLNISDGVINGLSTKGLVYRPSNVGLPYGTDIAYNIQDIAYNILQKHPEYLD
ncbi:MAG: uncharacterized membrane protein YobD (UPF0266 family) [Sulfurimonas sp.]|jgi:uncharacterized membrane protein YobD (UPF0266 family)|uniref:super-infection exclusion protein B n=1 Tax=Sulfurimonas sp. TaxID=2022749 RepID=UPI0039E22BD1